ncbi:hypothetical protein BSKO_08031 [Bryopsis sp. KO-2023]|nr:hypothetical protein BSKO_08031 [Bryopsis sp. KO-2023]
MCAQEYQADKDVAIGCAIDSSGRRNLLVLNVCRRRLDVILSVIETRRTEREAVSLLCEASGRAFEAVGDREVKFCLATIGYPIPGVLIATWSLSSPIPKSFTFGGVATSTIFYPNREGTKHRHASDRPRLVLERTPDQLVRRPSSCIARCLLWKLPTQNHLRSRNSWPPNSPTGARKNLCVNDHPHRGGD